MSGVKKRYIVTIRRGVEVDADKTPVEALEEIESEYYEDPTWFTDRATWWIEEVRE